MTTLNARLEIKSWDEMPTQELGGDRKVTRATVVLSAADDAMAVDGTWEATMFYPDKDNSTYTGIMHLSGRIGDRSGSFALTGDGRFADGTASGVMRVVPGSGTGDLAGIRGTARSVSTHADYPYMPFDLDYEVG